MKRLTFAFLVALAAIAGMVGDAQINTPDYGAVLIRATPTLDAITTMNEVVRDVNAAVYRLELAYAEAYRAQYTEAKLHVDSGMALLEEMLTRHAEGLARLRIYVDGNTKHNIGWEARAFFDTVIYEVAALKDRGKALRDVIYGMSGDYAADRVALDALLTGATP